MWGGKFGNRTTTNLVVKSWCRRLLLVDLLKMLGTTNPVWDPVNLVVQNLILVRRYKKFSEGLLRVYIGSTFGNRISSLSLIDNYILLVVTQLRLNLPDSEKIGTSKLCIRSYNPSTHVTRQL